MNISIKQIAQAIEATPLTLCDNPNEFKEGLILRLNYLVEHLIRAQEMAEDAVTNGEFVDGELPYAIGDVLNLLELIAEKV